MKKLHLLFAGAFAALAIVACSDDEIEPEPTPDPEPGTEYDDVYYAEHASISSADSRFTTTENGGEVHFKAEGGDVQVLVSCGTEWTVSSSNTAAFTAEITDTYYVTITAAQNLADEDLTGTVTLATAEMNIAFASIAVIQDGLGHITLSAEKLSFPRTGGEMVVTVESESDWDCECDSDWFSVVADTGAGTLTVTCDTNETGEVREGTVTVTAGDNSNNVAEATLTITQLAFDPDALVLEYTITSGTTIALPLNNADGDGNTYTINCTVDWGDGSNVATINNYWPTHYYSAAGTYNVIINGTVEALGAGRHVYGTYSIASGANCLTAVKQWGDTGLKSMDSAFYRCASLTSVPEGPGPFSNVKSFYNAFYFCESLTTVPEDMFSGCTAVENFELVFSYCYDLTSAPSFKGLSNVKNFGRAFLFCYSLTTAPDDMFSGCTAGENFELVFYDCSNLTSAPSFKGLSNATSFECAFYGCESLTTIPDDTFSGCTAVENFEWVLSATALTTVSENLFADCPLVESFEGVFYWCDYLVTVPENLFANHTAVKDFGWAFAYCTSLESVPVGIFDNNKLVTDFSRAFYDCPKLAGESPYTMIDEEKVHLYERENYPDYFTAPTDYSNCFTGSTFSDIDDIPTTWGGNGASPSSITPQSLNATASEEVIPSRLGPQRATKGPHGDAMTPQGSATRPLPTRK